MSIVQNLALAIADVEGFSSGKSKVAVQNNNPGNIRYWSASTPTRNGFAVFSSLDDGWNALYKVIVDYANGKYEYLYKKKYGKGYVIAGQPSLLEIFATYAPAEDRNNPISYAQTVSAKTGIPLDVPLNMVGAPPPTPKVEMSPIASPVLDVIEDNPLEYVFLPVVIGVVGLLLVKRIID